MVAAVKQIVTVKRGGVISLRIKELRAGDEVEVTVRHSEKSNRTNGHSLKSKIIKKGRVQKNRVHRMTKQDWGDVAWAKKIMAEPREKPIPHKNGKHRRFDDSGYPIARMTKQVRGDIAEVKRARKAIRERREKLIPWEQVRRELGLK